MKRYIAADIKGLEPAAARPFFNRVHGRSFCARGVGAVTEIELFDEIGGWGVSASDFSQQLREANGNDVRLLINSPGGDVFHGLAIYNLIAKYPGSVAIEVVGYAASIASIVAMAGDTLSMAANSYLMIHNAWTVNRGDKAMMARAAEVLTRIDAALNGIYANRSGLDAARISQMMDAETWLTAKEAVDMGFADDISAATQPKAKFDLSGFQHSPEALVAGDVAEKPTTRDTEYGLREAGHSRAQAKQMAALIHTDAGTQRDAEDKALWAGIAALTRSIKEITP